jgi:D-aspartate ligase
MIISKEYGKLRDIEKPQIIIFGVGNYNALGIVRSLGKQGYPIELVILNTDKKRNLVATKSKYVNSVCFVNTLEEGLNYITKNLTDSIKPYIITDDDKAQSLVDRSYSLLKDKFRVFNAGEPGRITRYMDKKNILDIAKKHGLQVATTITVPNGIIPKDLEYPIITKSISPLEGGWKSDVFICENEEDLKIAYTKIKAKTVLLQRYIDKQNEWCLDGVSLDNGNKIVTPLFSKYMYTIKGYYSPYMETKGYNQISEKEKELYSKLSEMLKDIGYEGIYSAEWD